MEWMVANAERPNPSMKLILDINGLGETTQLPISPPEPSPVGTKLPLDDFVDAAIALEPPVTHIGLKDYLEVLCYFVEELRRRLDGLADPQSNQGKGLRQLGLDVAGVFLQHTKPKERRWVVIWDRVHRALGNDMAPGIQA
ncbi:uncharacterized protein PAC_15255 [Phialocephala subalpina]|uniref:Uncharacterized protein n=1 Tax=Phialocephala subalpina TaxID=576137 RepID=A0A1L7XJX2_9HELO|nr:uncharacterized protein PAC_15255 [Phialocephala subalpina]